MWETRRAPSSTNRRCHSSRRHQQRTVADAGARHSAVRRQHLDRRTAARRPGRPPGTVAGPGLAAVAGRNAIDDPAQAQRDVPRRLACGCSDRRADPPGQYAEDSGSVLRRCGLDLRDERERRRFSVSAPVIVCCRIARRRHHPEARRRRKRHRPFQAHDAVLAGDELGRNEREPHVLSGAPGSQQHRHHGVSEPSGGVGRALTRSARYAVRGRQRSHRLAARRQQRFALRLRPTVSVPRVLEPSGSTAAVTGRPAGAESGDRSSLAHSRRPRRPRNPVDGTHLFPSLGISGKRLDVHLRSAACRRDHCPGVGRVPCSGGVPFG